VPYAGTTLYLRGSGASADTPFVLMLWDAPLAAPLAVGELITLNAWGQSLLFSSGITGASGKALVPVALPASLPAGTRLYGQFASADGVLQDWAASRGLEITTY
jgi:hypothetical protein